MRKIEAAMAMAVRSCVLAARRDGVRATRALMLNMKASRGRRVINGMFVRLHGNEIAQFDSALSGHASCRGLRITDAGWQTVTTKSRA